ncbi:MAG TPA: hypothetical protein VH280_23950 [Verrucomicrobiae bacterium]|jgi:hypothetical protein|nr:hypothetical protein [Verrucomicrobiae bacterium]
MSTESIEAHILKSEKNLRIAGAVAEAWLAVRKRLVHDFFRGVEKTLKKKLPGWECDLWGEYFMEAYPGFYVGKPTWLERYSINLECHQYGEKMLFGVWRNQKKLAKQPFCSEVLTAVRARFPSARSREWWEAEITMQTPARDWRKPESLWRIHNDAKFLEDVAEQLLSVAKTSEPIIDRLVAAK